ncbi:MAG: hypothetical protein DRG83_19440, partial [Deltaproteobacteria bacterium]
IILLTTTISTSANQVLQKRGVGQIIEMVNSIPDLIPSDKTALIFTLRDEFGDELFNISIESEYLESMKHVIIAGLFEEADPKSVVELTHKVYHAEKNGAPISFVEELAIVGLAKPITEKQLEAYAKSLGKLSTTHIDPGIYEEMISYGLANDWSAEVIRALTNGLLHGHNMGLNLRKLVLAFMMRVNQGVDKAKLSAMVEEEIMFLKKHEERNRRERERRDFAYQKMQKAVSRGVSEKIAQELYLQAIEGNWKKDVIKAVFEGMVEAKKLGLTPEKVALAMIVRIEQGLGKTSPEQMTKEEINYVKEMERERLAIIEKDRATKLALSTSKRIGYQSAVQRSNDLQLVEQEFQSSRSSLNVSLMAQTIRNFLGVPYRWGGTTRYGIDCSGFVQRVFREQGIYLPRVSRQQYRVGKYVPRNKLKYGDLVFFSKYGDGYITHVGVYIGNGRFAHSCCSKGVTISSLDYRYYRVRYEGARRVV